MDWDALARLLVVTLLGTGGATFVWAGTRSFIAWRDSAESREDKAVARLEKFEENCRKDLRWERALVAYWQARAGTLEYTLTHAGVAVPEPMPMPLRVDTDREVP